LALKCENKTKKISLFVIFAEAFEVLALDITSILTRKEKG
jgi:hypothetical protein